MDGFLDGWWMATTFQQKTVTSAGSWQVMIWAEILGSEMEGPFKVSEGIKMTFGRYVEFITGHFQLWYKKEDSAFWNTMHSALSHAAKKKNKKTKKHHKTVWKCISTPTVNVSLCEVWLVVAEMHLYAQLPACMERLLRLQRRQQLQIPVCCSTLAFLIAALLIQLIFLTGTFINKPLSDWVLLCSKSLTNLMVIW